MHGAIYVEDSGNSKLKGSHKIDSTYASIKATCPSTCALKKSKACYAMNSMVGMHVRRLDKKARQHSPLKLARAEARCIDESYRGGPVPAGRDLRIHTSGDSRLRAGTRLIAHAIDRWLKRGGQAAFGYTHAWMNVPREAWGRVSILASIESVNQVEAARKMGYPVAIVVPEHADDKAYKLAGCDTTFVPCPAQTHDTHCSDCRLCMKGDWLFESNRGISFAAHGIRKNELKRRLTIVE